MMKRNYHLPFALPLRLRQKEESESSNRSEPGKLQEIAAEIKSFVSAFIDTLRCKEPEDPT